ncbi:acyl-CoA dehydrogenase family protein (plasmid) [Streptomyces sp. GDS52]|uniref:acyl-CoA dehydrogenase family protein n=1 Tax=Streptomyces sp. GDS52 TaxID=3406419 RepID=UPI003FD2C771
MSTPYQRLSLHGHRLAGAGGLRAEVRAFAAEEIAAGHWTPRCDNWLIGWDPAFSERLAARGWVGMTIPAEYGGQEAGALARFVVTEELLAAGAPVAAHWIADRQTAPQLLGFGTEEQKRRFLPEIAAGRTHFALGMSEPDSGSDLASVRTRAERTDGGWRVTGRKIWTSGAHRAHYLTALVRTTPRDEATGRHDGLSQLILDLADPGIEVRPIRLLNGEAHFAEVVIEDVFVPDAMVLGEIGQGWRQINAELAYERSGPERVLSTAPLLLAHLDEIAARGGTADPVGLGLALARLSALRGLTASVAVELTGGHAPDVAAALAKDLGTRFEGEVVDVVRRSRPAGRPEDTNSAETERLLRQAVLQQPGFTLRGGTTEILRGVVTRGMGLR